MTLPDSWRQVALGTVAQSRSGLTFRPGDLVAQSSADAVACFRTSNVQADLETHDLLYLPQRLVGENDLLQAGDIVVSTANSAELVGKCALVPKLNYPATIGGFVAALRPNPQFLDPEFLYFWMSSETAQRRLRSLARQTTNISNLPPSEMARAMIPLPPLKEQERIATILKGAAELRRVRIQSHEAAQKLIPSIFNGLFGTPASWKSPRKLRDCVQIVGGGTPSRSSSQYFTGAIPWATSKDVKRFYLADAEEHITEQAVEESATNIVPAGTVLMVVKSKILAHSLPLAITQRPFCFGQDLKGLVPNAGISPEFIAAGLQIQEGHVLNRARGVNTEGLTIESIQGLLLPQASEDQMAALSARVKLAWEFSSERDESAPLFGELDAAISAYAFTGDLTARWRERHRSELVTQIRERDNALRQLGAKLPVAPTQTIAERESRADARKEGAYAELTPQQADLLAALESMAQLTAKEAESAGSPSPRAHVVFTPASLAAEAPGRLRHQPDLIRRELEVLTARGLVLRVSRRRHREAYEPDAFGDLYRLPARVLRFGEFKFGETARIVAEENIRDNELLQLATKLGGHLPT